MLGAAVSSWVFMRFASIVIVPGKSVSEAVDIARETGTVVRRKPEELYDNSFVNNLEKSGFFKELWGNENYRR